MEAKKRRTNMIPGAYAGGCTALLAAVGALFGGPMSNSLGRKPVITIASVLFIFGALVVALSSNFKVFYA